MMSKHDIVKMMEVSTLAISQSTRDYLERAIEDSNLGVIVYDKPKYGWFVVVFKESYEENAELIPADLMKLLVEAEEQGCQWLMFDDDIEPLEGEDNYA